MRMRDSLTLGTGEPFGGAGRGRYAPDLEFPFLSKLLSHLATRNPGNWRAIPFCCCHSWGCPPRKRRKINVKNRKISGRCVIKTASLEIICFSCRIYVFPFFFQCPFSIARKTLWLSPRRALTPTPYICAIPGSDITDNRLVQRLNCDALLIFHHHPFSIIGKRASLARTPETNRFFLSPKYHSLWALWLLLT